VYNITHGSSLVVFLLVVDIVEKIYQHHTS